MSYHIVRQGETIRSIASQYGLNPDTLWERNPDLRELRDSPNQLHAGDRVFIPERETGEESGGTEERHRLRAAGQTSLIKIRFLREDEPRAGERYVFSCNGDLTEGHLDDEGRLEERVPADAELARVLLGESSNQQAFNIMIGHLDPIEEIEGRQERLSNLGFPCGTPDSEAGSIMQAAVSAFQDKHELDVTGEVNDETRQQLLDAHDW